MEIGEGPRKGEHVTLRQVTRREAASRGAIRQVHTLTSRTDLPAGEVCWRMSSRWREENYFRYARTHFALDALTLTPRSPTTRTGWSPARRRKPPPRGCAGLRPAIGAAEASRDASLLELRSPAPGHAALLTNQQVNELNAPSGPPMTSWKRPRPPPRPPPPGSGSATSPGHGPAGRRDQAITHAIRMAAYNAETILARALDGHYTHAHDEAYALIREALATSGEICPGPGQLLVRLDPLTAPRRTQALAALCEQLNQAGCTYPGTDLLLRDQVKVHSGPA